MELLYYPHPMLRFKAKTLKRVTNDVRICASQMIELMKEENGIGLSATQVGLPFRMFVIEWEGSELCFVNPIIKPFGKRKVKEEGCLSFPDVFLKVNRPANCSFNAWDLHGNEIDEEVSGDLARVLQHEVDHLDGTMFIDRVSDLARESIAPHLGMLEHMWARFPKPFPQKEFNELLYEYCGVERPTENLTGG